MFGDPVNISMLYVLMIHLQIVCFWYDTWNNASNSQIWISVRFVLKSDDAVGCYYNIFVIHSNCMQMCVWNGTNKIFSELRTNWFSIFSITSHIKMVQYNNLLRSSLPNMSLFSQIMRILFYFCVYFCFYPHVYQCNQTSINLLKYWFGKYTFCQVLLY